MTTQEHHKSPHRLPWFDPRFAIGLVLVLASVVGVYLIVTAADRSTEVYSARGPLVAGDPVTSADLVVTKVRLGAADRLYLAGGASIADGAVLTRSLAAGELVPVSAIGNETSRTTTSIVVRVRGDLAASVVPGSRVDVWSAVAVKDRAATPPPSVVVGGATVVRVITADGLVAGRDERSVELRVPAESVAAVLQAVANENVISLVPAAPGAALADRAETDPPAASPPATDAPVTNGEKR